ncbi:MAG: penicillin acylase family protein [Nocardioides sp.]
MTHPTSSRPRGRPGRLYDGYRVWPRAARTASYVVVLVLALVLIVGVTTTVLVRRPLPQDDGSARLPGLAADVEVVRDGHGIPQIYADSVPDLMRAQGYVAAQERFFQMDLRRHQAAGTMSELFGARMVAADELARSLGWRRVAAKELALVSPETRAALQEYADGVNAYLESRPPGRVAVEYTVLRTGGFDYTPAPWTPTDSLSWLVASSWDLQGPLSDEIDRVLSQAGHLRHQVSELYLPEGPDIRPVVGQGAVVDGVYEQDATTGGTRNPQRPAFGPRARTALTRLSDRLAAMPELVGRGDGIGSNSWVVDGAHSATGKPLLAADPHLGVGVPGVWLQTGLHCRTVTAGCPYDVSGFGYAGVPGIVDGHNAHISWALTNQGSDVSDLFVEKVRGDRSRYAGKWRPLRTREERIKVRDGADVTLTVRSTRHGPLLSDVDDDLRAAGESRGTGLGIAVDWTGLRPSRTADAILGLDRARDWTDFRAAAAHLSVPAQNIVYADTAGHIGFQATGRIPIRKSGNAGATPVAGWRPENDWTGASVPYSALPTVLDPKDGFVVAANQRLVERDYPYPLSSEWDQGYRATRIRDLISQGGKLTVEDMTRLQLDDHNPLAPALVPALLRVHLPHGYWSAGQALLQHWDFDQPADGAAAAYFNVVWRDLLAATFHDELPEAAWPDGGQRWMAVVTRLLRRPDASWWDDRATDQRETRDDILRRALLEARNDLTALRGRSTADWTWGGIHQLRLQPPGLGESGSPPVRWLLDRAGWQIGGGPASVDATSWDARQGYDVTTAPSMRMVVSLGDLDASRWIDLTGVSGQPADDNYVDQTGLWARGQTLPWAFSADAVAASRRHTLTLTPSS